MELPLARKANLTVRELPEETLVYDLERHKAHCLNRTSALVWKHCDGHTSLDQLAGILQRELGIGGARAAAALACEQLSRRHLLERSITPPPPEKRMARRDALKRLALAALPLIVTFSAPDPVAASSRQPIESTAQCKPFEGGSACFNKLGLDEECAFCVCLPFLGGGICQCSNKNEGGVCGGGANRCRAGKCVPVGSCNVGAPCNPAGAAGQCGPVQTCFCDTKTNTCQQR